MRTDRPALWVAVLFAAGLCGCGGRPGTYPVSGRVTLADGDTAQLAGHIVEAALTTDRTVRASGVVDADGRFSLETLDGGKLLRGAREGTYDVRIVVVREGDGHDRRPPLAPRFQEFKTSGLSVRVPAAGEVQLSVASK